MARTGTPAIGVRIRLQFDIFPASHMLLRYGVGGDDGIPAVLGDARLRGRKRAGRRDGLVAVLDSAGISRVRKLSAGSEPVAPHARRGRVASVADHSPQKLVGSRRDRGRSRCRISTFTVPGLRLVERRRGKVRYRVCINRQVAPRCMTGDDVTRTAARTVYRKNLRVTTTTPVGGDVLMHGCAIPRDRGVAGLVIGGDQQGLTC